MRITIDIETDNAAFSDDLEAEVLRIASEHLKRFGLIEGKLRDYNGNTVGRVTIEDDEPEPESDEHAALCASRVPFGECTCGVADDADDDEPQPHDARPTVDFHE